MVKCSACGKNGPLTKDLCASCYRRELYRRRAAEAEANGLCVKCYTAPAATGKRMCVACLEAVRARYQAQRESFNRSNQQYYKRNRDACRERRRLKYHNAIAQGICGLCLKWPCRPGKALCKHCVEKKRHRRQGVAY